MEKGKKRYKELPFLKKSSLFFLPSDVLCPELNVGDVELESRLQGRKIGMTAAFSCPSGFELVGTAKTTCLKSGE